MMRKGIWLASVSALVSACTAPQTQSAGVAVTDSVYRADSSESVGVALDIVLDNSGSMDDRAPGDQAPKYKVARAAVMKMLEATDAFVIAHPDFPVKIALHVFSGDVRLAMPMRVYSGAAVRAALDSIEGPGGNTAIGRAMEEARAELYKSNVFRKNMLVITDGENTAGPSPEEVAREIFTKSEGGVGMYFVAFDTNIESLAFVKDVRGEVMAASNASSLEAALSSLYQGKILAEKAGAVEPIPARVMGRESEPSAAAIPADSSPVAPAAGVKQGKSTSSKRK